MAEDCIFCKMSKNEIKTEKIYENDNFFSIFDINPKVEGHALVICKKHFKNVLEMPNTLATEMLDAIKNTSMKLINEKKADGFNIVFNTFEAAGQVVGHVHAHILPRKQGDGYKVVE